MNATITSDAEQVEFLFSIAESVLIESDGKGYVELGDDDVARNLNWDLEYVEDDDYSTQLCDGWQVLSGHSGQHGYSGPLMHPSEFVGGGLARYIAETPGHYATAIVYEERVISYCVKCDVEECESPNRVEELEREPVGWVVLYRPLD